jgi:hypothetical protein
MTPESALIELLGRLGARLGESVTVSSDELSHWPAAAVSALKSQGLLLKARPAKSVVCPGCEQECSMPVNTLARTNAPASSFVVCDKRSDINRVPIPTARLALWRCDAQTVCGFVASSLGLQPSTVQAIEAGLLPIGMVRGNKRNQMLCLRHHGHLSLVVGADTLPMADVVGFEGGSFTLDHAVILRMVDAATTADSRHTPSTAKREARKIDTQTMYANWQKAYRASRKNHPNKSDVWHSQQIAKTPIAQGRNPSTIKKNMVS